MISVPSCRFLYRLWPGLGLSLGVTLLALLVERVESLVTGKVWLEALVLAILLGAGARTLWTPPACFAEGIDCAAKTLLEAAIVLMGVSLSFATLAVAGWPLILAIGGTVIAAIGVSFTLGRWLGLSGRMALLVACGNAICGNSAIAAVAPVIDADSDDVATAIAFTAVLGIGVVLMVPVIGWALHLSPAASGVFAGLTVYAVPQVMAAVGTMGGTAIQVGTLVKLVRVLMLGPVVTGLSLLYARPTAGATSGLGHRLNRAGVRRLVPPFILAFLVCATLNSLGWLPSVVTEPAQRLSGFLTVMAMAGMGLGVDLRQVTAAGTRVVCVVTASLLSLAAMAVLVLSVLRMI